MASVHNYSFDNLTRIGNDNCGINARDVQNNSQGSYSTTNYFLGWCNMKDPIDFATKQPNVFFRLNTLIFCIVFQPVTNEVSCAFNGDYFLNC